MNLEETIGQYEAYAGADITATMTAREAEQLAEWLRELKALRIAVYKLSRIPYGECLTYNADDIWNLFGAIFTDFEEEVMEYEVKADDE